MKLISVNCIKKYYPNDIGAAAVFKNIVGNYKIKAVKKIDSQINRHDPKLPTNRKVSYFPLEKVEEAIQKQKDSMLNYANVFSRDRLEEVIQKLKEETQC